MINDMRWDQCINHRDADALRFISSYFSDKASPRRCLLICGAGFDPRATHVADQLVAAAPQHLRAVLIREERPNADEELHKRADKNQAKLTEAIPDNVVCVINVFSDDEKTVVGGRRITQKLVTEPVDELTDIIIDISALSIGISFPIVQQFFNQASVKRSFPNVHVMVTTSPSIDGAVSSEVMDKLQMVHGFDPDFGTEAESKKPKLWIPQLSGRAQSALKLIFQRLDPEEVCPVLPFPAANPRAVEELMEVFQEEVSGSWSVDARDFLYAAEGHPLDLYRTILRVDAMRRLTYEVEEGSITVLSPLGTKAMALGALLAALDRKLPIAYVESLKYQVQFSDDPPPPGLIHLWLTGEVYPSPD